MRALGLREWEEVRTKRNLSYKADAYYVTPTDVPFVVLTVAAVDPGATMKVMLDEARKLREQAVPEKELLGALNQA